LPAYSYQTISTAHDASAVRYQAISTAHDAGVYTLRAVRFLEGHQTGFFDMQDVLGLR